jgi:hypothetical protein
MQAPAIAAMHTSAYVSVRQQSRRNGGGSEFHLPLFESANI